MNCLVAQICAQLWDVCGCLIELFVCFMLSRRCVYSSVWYLSCVCLCALQHCAGAVWRLVLTHPLLIVLVVTAVRLWQGHIGCTATGSFSLLFQWNELPVHSQSLPPLPLEPVSPVSFPPEHIHSVPVLLQLVLCLYQPDLLTVWTSYQRASLG